MLLGGSAIALGYPNLSISGGFQLKRTKTAQALGHAGRQKGAEMSGFVRLWPPVHPHSAVRTTSWCPAMYLSYPGMFRVQKYVLEPRNVAFWAHAKPSKNPSRARLLAVFAITAHRQRKPLKSYVRIFISGIGFSLFCLILNIGPTVAPQINFYPPETAWTFFESLF